MLLMVEKGIRGGIWHSIKRYVKANNKYMKDYDKNKESHYLKYWDVNDWYGSVVSQKLFVNDFKWAEDISEFHENFIKSYNEESDEGYFLEVDLHYPEQLHDLHNDLPFFHETMKIAKVIANLHDKIEYAIHVKNFKQALTLG